MVDAAVEVKMSSEKGDSRNKDKAGISTRKYQERQKSESDECIQRIVPFELKTGKRTHISHRAQVLLYTLLMSDRHDEYIDTGLLFNVSQGQMEKIKTVPRFLFLLT